MRFLLLFLMAMLTACGSAIPNVKPFKMDIQQGNVVTSKMLLKLRPGMTKSQVKYIMGTPLVVDSFHTNRWDYFYQMRQSGQVTEKRRVILDFDKDLLVRVRGDVVAEGSADAVKLANEPPPRVYVKPEEKAKEAGLLDKLKFWDKSEAVPAAAAVAVTAAASADAAATATPKTETTNADVSAAPNAAAADASPTASMLAVPLANAPVVVEPVLPAVEPTAPVAEQAAAPATVEPPAPIAETPPVAAPAEITPDEPVQAVPAPVAEAPVAPAPAVLPVAEAPAVVEPAQIRANKSSYPTSKSAYPEKLIFRMDRTLDLERGNQVLMDAPVPTPKPAAPVKAPEPAPPAKETSFFDKMLEKIGF